MVSITMEKLGSSVWLGLTLVVLYPILKIVYNLALHPLARFPGPLLWRSVRITYICSIWSGRSHTHFQRLHERYGPIVRVAPNELSFADTAAWKDLYSNRGTSNAFPRNVVWHGAPEGHENAIINCLEKDEHSRMRKKMESGFTERAVQSQEPIVQGYVDMLIRRLRERMAVIGDVERGEATIDVSKWLTWVSLDITGDLSFGEGFGCLEKSQMNEWMGLLFGSLKFQVFLATLRYYSWLSWTLQRLIPKSVKESAEEHWRIVEDKVNRRLERKTSRADFMGLWQKEGKGQGGLTLGEIYSNAFIMMFAGSETMATCLTGTIRWLVNHPEKLALLTHEVRDRFAKEEDITFSELKDLGYLNAVLWEGLRMCTPFPLGHKRITPPAGGVVCGQYIPPNTFVSMNFLALFLDKGRFYEADAFHPERWLPDAGCDTTSPFYNDDRNAVQPFGAGPMMCIGKPLAIAEARAILAKLVWAFDMEKANTAAGNLVWEDQRTYTLVEKEAFDVKLTLRSKE